MTTGYTSFLSAQEEMHLFGTWWKGKITSPDQVTFTQVVRDKKVYYARMSQLLVCM